MAKQFKWRRGSTSEHDTFTGDLGEVTVDTDKDGLVVHDGSTAGGFPLLTGIENWANVHDYATPGIPIGDANAFDATPAFQAAIEAARPTVVNGFFRSGVVVVPHTANGYAITNLKLKSHTHLLGLGGQVGLLSSHIAATATANLTGDAVTSITMGNLGTRYPIPPASPPTITITGDGTGATATATVNAFGNITSIAVDTGGSGYTSATVEIPVLNVINVDGEFDDNASTIIRKTLIENFYIHGAGSSGSSGHGVFYSRHDNNTIRNCKIDAHAGDGIKAQNGGSAVNDGLLIDTCIINDNGLAGIRLETSSHYCSVTGASRIAGNLNGAINVKGTGFTMFGGVIGGLNDGSNNEPMVLIAGTSAGGMWGVHLETTPAMTVAGTMIQLGSGSPEFRRARGFTVDGCVYGVTGSDVDITIIKLLEADGCSIRGGYMDSVSATANTIGIDVTSSANTTVIDNVRFGGQLAGSGSFTDIVYGTSDVDARIGLTRPNQPAFFYHADGTQINFASGALTEIVFATKEFDRGDLFESVTANHYSVPIDGIYHFTASIRLQSWDIDAPDYTLRFTFPDDGGAILNQVYSTSQMAADADNWMMVLTGMREMSAGDRIRVEISENAAGAAQSDILADSYFMGHLIG